MAKPAAWKVLDSEYVLTNPWMTVRADQCETESGLLVDAYYVQESCDWVQVLALDDQDQVLVTRQYRHGVKEISLELPAGCVDAEEKPLTAMKRELLEETGCEAKSFKELPPLYPNPARCENLIHHYVARGVKVVAEPDFDDAELIEFEFIPLDDLLASIYQGRFKSALHISTIFMGLAELGYFSATSKPLNRSR